MKLNNLFLAISFVFFAWLTILTVWTVRAEPFFPFRQPQQPQVSRLCEDALFRRQMASGVPVTSSGGQAAPIIQTMIQRDYADQRSKAEEDVVRYCQ